ncbi:MAG: hypothetical protein ACOX6S_00885 [Clostridia bacterium]|jgi:hypothetical protein
MNNGRMIGRVFMMTMTKWMMAPKAIITALLLTAFCVVQVHSLYEYVAEEGQILNVLEPYLCLLQSTFVMVIFVACSTILFCDAPFFELGQAEILYRVGRFRWYAGKVLYIMASAALSQLFLLAAFILLTMDIGFWGNYWSDAVYSLSLGGTGGAILTLPTAMMQATTPYMATVQTFVLCWLFSCLTGMILFLVNLKFKRIYGYLIVSSLCIIGMIVETSGGTLPYWLSPLHYAMLAYQKYGPGSRYIPSLTASYLVLGLPLLGLLIVTYRRLAHHSFQFGE